MGGSTTRHIIGFGPIRQTYPPGPSICRDVISTRPFAGIRSIAPRLLESEGQALTPDRGSR
jgi:hypothetical protein